MSDLNKPSNETESNLRSTLAQDTDNWEVRKQLAHLLYNQGNTEQAADTIWSTPEIPTVDLELGFAIKVLAKGAPRKAIRLLSSIQESNRGKPVQNLGLANALMHHGMVMEAARFYGAAVAESSDLASADIEHFLLWTDDNEKIWGDFNDKKPVLGDLPWMKRDAKEAELLKKSMMGHTTPIKLPNLQKVSTEKPAHEIYVQSSQKGAEATPPPSVIIPSDRVKAKDLLVDEKLGAETTPAQPQTPTPPATRQTPAQADKPSLPQAAPAKPMTPPSAVTPQKPGLPQASAPAQADKPSLPQAAPAKPMTPPSAVTPQKPGLPQASAPAQADKPSLPQAAPAKPMTPTATTSVPQATKPLPQATPAAPQPSLLPKKGTAQAPEPTPKPKRSLFKGKLGLRKTKPAADTPTLQKSNSPQAEAAPQATKPSIPENSTLTKSKITLRKTTPAIDQTPAVDETPAAPQADTASSAKFDSPPPILKKSPATIPVLKKNQPTDSTLNKMGATGPVISKIQRTVRNEKKD